MLNVAMAPADVLRKCLRLRRVARTAVWIVAMFPPYRFRRLESCSAIAPIGMAVA